MRMLPACLRTASEAATVRASAHATRQLRLRAASTARAVRTRQPTAAATSPFASSPRNVHAYRP